MTPVSADVVAQIVAEAQHKLQMGMTPPVGVRIMSCFSNVK